MKLLAINTALAREMKNSTGSFATGIYKQPTDYPVAITRLGIAGDAIVDTSVHGGADQPIYIYLKEDYDWWSEQLGNELSPGTFGENFIIDGLADRNILIGDTLNIGDTVLEVSAPRVPCHKLASRMGSAEFVKDFIRANRPGFYVRVKREGTVAVGDDVTYIATTGDYASIREVFYQWHAKNRSLEIMEKALSSPLSIHHRIKMQAWYEKQLQSR